MSDEGQIQLHRGIRAVHLADSKGITRWMFVFTVPCTIGLKCPHMGWSEEDGPICIHPYTMANCPEDEVFPMLDEADVCPLVEDNSVLDGFLSAYGCDGNLVVDVIDHINLMDRRECMREGDGVKELMVMRALSAFWRMAIDE